MGNRALITTRREYEKDGIAVYLHWNGGYDSVSAFLKYCELKGYRPPDQDCYGWARLCQVIGNYFGGTLSLGICNFSKEAGEWQDNGTYIIEGWEIVGREHYDYEEQMNYDMHEMLIEIDQAQPVKEQFGDFLKAKEVPVETLEIGDVVWFYNDIYGRYDKHTVVGFGDKGPYVDRYGDAVEGYDWNPNNYIRTATVRIVK